MQFINQLFYFFFDNFPSLKLILWLFPVSLIWSFIALYIAGFCKNTLLWKTAYSRKLFHFFIFISAFIYQQFYGLAGVFILGWSVSLILIYAIVNGSGNFYYEALAREKDAQFQTKYIVYSYLSTLLGGVSANLFFGSFAIFGYLVTGIADALAEPFGSAFGRHQYKVFSFDKAKKSYKSLEGSAAFFIVTIISLYFSYMFNATLQINYFLLISIALLCTLIEAFTPSGFDNFTLQVGASFFCSILLVN